MGSPAPREGASRKRRSFFVYGSGRRSDETGGSAAYARIRSFAGS